MAAFCIGSTAFAGGGGGYHWIDFNLEHGRIVSDQYYDSAGLYISAINPNRSHDIAAIFDSSETGTSDPDLEGPDWAAGNLAPDTELLGMLIIAENDFGGGDGILDDPDDEGSRPAGELIFEFDGHIDEFGFDLIDIDDAVAESGSVEFYLDGDHVQSVAFIDFIDPFSDYYDPSVEYADNSANRIEPILASVAAWDEIRIIMGGSGAIDNLHFRYVPAPGAITLLLGGLLAAPRRRRG